MLRLVAKSIGLMFAFTTMIACADGTDSSGEDQSDALEAISPDMLTEEGTTSLVEWSSGESALDGVAVAPAGAQSTPPIDSFSSTHTFSIAKGTQDCFDLGYVFANSSIALSMIASPKARLILRRRITLSAAWQVVFDSGIKYGQYNPPSLWMGSLAGYYQVCAKAGTDLAASGNISYTPSNACP